MAYWHELARIRARLTKYTADRKAMQIVQRCDQNPELFAAHYERRESKDRTRYPEGWIELWPLEPITAPTALQARDKALPLLEAVASRTQDHLFEIRPCPIPIRLKEVKAIHSPSHHARARIFKHAETRYEVRYFGDIIGSLEEGWRLAVPTVEGMPVPENFQMLTLADSLESAEQIAAVELERLVAGGEIKPK